MPSTLSRPAPRLSRLAWSALKLSAGAIAIVVLLEMVPTLEARAQVVAKSKDEKQIPIDTRPLARYVPKDKLLLLIESDGLEAQAEAWNKTAANGLLNETTLGEMLEAMFAQLSDRLLTYSPIQKLSGADVLLLVKHAAKHGFIIGGVAQEDRTPAVIVFRGGYAVRESRAAFGRLMGLMMGPSKFASIKKGGRTVAQVTPASGKPWFWWPEQGDLVISENADAVIAVIDGKAPNAIDHPIRAALAKNDAGFSPLGLIFLDPSAAGQSKSSFVEKANKALGALGLTGFDFRWGIQDEALMTVARFQAPKPRKGFFAVVEQPAFDRTKFLPIPATIESFTTFTLDANKALDVILPALPPLPPQAGALTDGIASLESKSRVDIRKDILGRIGPKMVAYVMPGSAPTRTPTDAAPKADLNPLSGMLGIPLPGMGGVAFPRYTLLAELKDPAGMEIDLDNLMVALNKELRTQAAEAEKAMEAAERAGGRAGGPGGRAGRGGLGDFGGPGGRRPAGPTSAPEFKLMPGKEKVFVLTMPPDQVKQLPAGFRPTIRLGGKYIVISANPEAARLAIEAKADAYTPAAEVAVSLDRLPKLLSYLNVYDPRSTEPELLSTLPGTLQGLVNALLALAPAPASPPAAAASAPARGGAPASGPPAGNVASGPRSEGRRGRDEFSGPATKGAPPNIPPGMESMVAAMGGVGGPGGPGGPQAPKKPQAAKTTPFYFDIDASLLPSVEDIKAKLFPTVLAISSDDKEIVIQSRGAFPNPISKEMINAITFGIPMGAAMQQGGAPAMAPPGGPMAGPGSRPGAPGVPPVGGGGEGRGRRAGGGGASRSEP